MLQGVGRSFSSFIHGGHVQRPYLGGHVCWVLFLSHILRSSWRFHPGVIQGHWDFF